MVNTAGTINEVTIKVDSRAALKRLFLNYCLLGVPRGYYLELLVNGFYKGYGLLKTENL